MNESTGQGGRSFGKSFDREDRQMYPAKCSDCGADIEVPFQPREGRPIYCLDDLRKHRDQGDLRR